MSHPLALPLAQRLAFGETVDPSSHVPRARTEAILDALVDWCGREGPGSTVAALVAPPGFGKTHLLRVLEARLRARDPQRAAGCAVASTLYLPYAAVSLVELASWIEGLRSGPRAPGARPPSKGPATSESEALTWLKQVGASERGSLALLIDDADSMPETTLRALVQGLPSEDSPIRLVLALTDDSRAARMLAACDRLAPFEQILREPLDEPETEAYLRARLAQAKLDVDLLDGLDAATLRRIHALSGGVPRRIHRIVLALLEPDRAALARALAPHHRVEDWLGQPLLDPL